MRLPSITNGRQPQRTAPATLLMAGFSTGLMVMDMRTTSFSLRKKTGVPARKKTYVWPNIKSIPRSGIGSFHGSIAPLGRSHVAPLS